MSARRLSIEIMSTLRSGGIPDEGAAAPASGAALGAAPAWADPLAAGTSGASASADAVGTGSAGAFAACPPPPSFSPAHPLAPTARQRLQRNNVHLAMWSRLYR